MLSVYLADNHVVEKELVDIGWKPPNHGLVKINFDAAIKRDNIVGIGLVARDDHGDFLWDACLSND